MGRHDVAPIYAIQEPRIRVGVISSDACHVHIVEDMEATTTADTIVIYNNCCIVN